MTTLRESTHTDLPVAIGLLPIHAGGEPGRGVDAGALVDLIDRCLEHGSAEKRRHYIDEIVVRTEACVDAGVIDAMTSEDALPMHWAHLKDIVDEMTRVPLGSRRIDQCLSRLKLALRHVSGGSF
jgi:hypothetical protein